MSDFELQLKAFADKTRVQVDRIITGAILDFTGRVEDRTPVDTGFLRAHWYLSADEPGGEAGFSFPAEVGGHVYYLTNGTAYGRRIEYGFTGEDSLGRHYDQPGRGMVGLTVIEWEDIVRRQANARG